MDCKLEKLRFKSQASFVIETLKSRSSVISDKKAFYQGLGIKCDDQWIPFMAKHSLLYEKSEYNETKVIDRLKNELEIDFFIIYDEIKKVLEYDNDNMFTLRDVESLKNVNAEKFIFAVDTPRGGTSDYGFKFNYWRDFAIPYGWVWKEQSERTREVSLLCKPVDVACDFVSIETVHIYGK